MRIIVAETAGFCWGVQRALDIALDVSRSTGQKVYTYGPLIHNHQVVAELEKRDILTLDGEPEGAQDGKLVVRAHGIRPDVMTDIQKRHGNVIDASCPLVMKVHRQILKHQTQGYQIYIMGDPKHPEVIGLMGAANDQAVVIPPHPDEVGKLSDGLGRVCLVSQTTQNDDVFARVAAALKPKCEELRIVNTICEPTRSHQMETIDMAGRVDTVVVVGGRHSANTRHLAELARELGPRVIHVETDVELHASDFGESKVVGITAGASTPQWMIQRVVDRLESFDAKGGALIRALKQAAGWLITTHVFTVLSFSALFAAMHVLVGAPVDWTVFALTVSLVFGLHCINEFREEAGFDRKSRLSPVAFERFRRAMLTLAALAVSGSVLGTALLYARGSVPPAFLVLILVSGAGGVLYGSRLIPARLVSRFGFSSIKDLPGSKDISVAGGWSLLLFAVPLAIWGAGSLSLAQLTALGAALFFSVYRRTAILVVRDAQGDRIVGMESSLKFLGKTKGRRLHMTVDALIPVLLVVLFAAIPVSQVIAGLIIFAAAWGLAVSVAYHIKRLPAGNTGLFLLDCQFVLPGLFGTAFWALKTSGFI